MARDVERQDEVRQAQRGLVTRRVFGEGEDPLSWSIPLVRLGPVQVRLHLVLLLWAAAELVAWLPKNTLGPVYVGGAVAAFAVMALVRELGRAVVARMCGSDVDQVMVWPLGGLTPVHRLGRRGPLVSESGGLVVGMVLWPVLALACFAVGVPWSGLVFNPFAPGVAVSGLSSPAQIALWWLYYANAVIVALNVLLPMLPMDAGRMAQIFLKGRLGPHAAAVSITRVGLVVALTLFVLAAVGEQTRLMALAAFGALATWLEFRRAQMTLGFAAAVGVRPAPEKVEPSVNGGMDETVVSRIASEPISRVMPRGEQAGEDELDAGASEARLSEEALDAILAKISRGGLSCLTTRERELLDAETKRRRGG